MSEMMTAAVYRGNRSFVIEQRAAKPPEPGEVAVGVAYCGICGTDMHVFHGNMDARVGHNRVIGHEMSGMVTALGEGVSRVAVGQKVSVRPLDSCGDCPACEASHRHICHNLRFLGLDTDGAMQQIWNVPAHVLHILPDGLRMEHAALVEPVAVACHDVRRAALRVGEDVLVIGGGPIGILCAMVARASGGRVLLSEVNPHRVEIARKLGFDVINPSEEDLSAVVATRTEGKGADIVFEVSGTQAGVDDMTACAAVRSRIVMVAIHAQKPKIDLFQFFWRELELLGARVYEEEDYEQAIAILADGDIDVDAVITEIRPLSAIQTAFEDLDTSPTALKSLIKVGEPQCV